MKQTPKPTDLAVVIDWDNNVLELRQSAIQTFMDCRRHFHRSYVQSLEIDYPEGPRPWGTADTGTAMHEGLGAYYLGKQWNRAISAWGRREWPDGPPEDHQLDLVRIMVEGHLSDLAEDGKDVGETTVAVEEEVRAVVEDVVTANGVSWSVVVHGRVDRRIETDTGINIIDDWKSVGPLTSTLDYIQQLGRYAVMIRASTGWRADRVRTTQIRRVKRTKDGPFYNRPWVPLNEDAYAEHAANLRHQLSDLVTCVENDGPWYEHVTGECDWKCRVKDICRAMQQGDDPELIVELHYRKKEHRT